MHYKEGIFTNYYHKGVKKGIFRNHFIIRIMANHFFMLRDALKQPLQTSSTHDALPCGALLISLCAVSTV